MKPASAQIAMRIVKNEPFAPLGGEVKLTRPTDVPVDDAFDPEERAHLLQAIDDGVQDFERGDHTDGFDFIAQMRARREAANR